MESQIVDAEKDDVERLIEIYSSPHLYHSKEEAMWLVKPFFEYHHIKIVKNEGRVIGALFWKVVEEKHHGLAEIGEFWIDENFRRKGFGERLLRTSIDDMREFYASNDQKLRKVLVTTGEDNEAARNLYEKVGFEKSAALPDLFGEGETELVYILTIRS
jgi:ribosomal protein S18 acetylase RimI-like enzyme